MGVSRAEQAGRRLAETINEQAHLMYQVNTKSNFFKGLIAQLAVESECHTCCKKFWCKDYGSEDCSEYLDQATVI